MPAIYIVLMSKIDSGFVYKCQIPIKQSLISYKKSHSSGLSCCVLPAVTSFPLSFTLFRAA